MRRGLLIAVSFALFFAWPSAAPADVIGEGATALRCAEDADLSLPKTMTLTQTIAAAGFAAAPKVFLYLDAEYEALGENGRGKIVATVVHRMGDGSSVKLGKFKAKFDADGRAEGDKLAAATLAPGDTLEWTLKLKQLPPVRADDEDCWELAVGVAVGDELE